ncbi:hypothetical protein ACHAQA_006478 [Verticillium albo-atrum]
MSSAPSEDSYGLSLNPSTAPTTLATPHGSSCPSPILKVSGPTDAINDVSSIEEGTSPCPLVRNICCVGAGYVGGPTAAVIAFQNPQIRVTIVDRDEGRIRRWNSKHPPIYEPGLRDIVRIARDGSRKCSLDAVPRTSQELNAGEDPVTITSRPPNLFFSTNVAEGIAEADLVLISVNTPTKTRGIGAGSATDMTAFEAVTSVVAQHAKSGAIIVEKSTVPCRTAEMVAELTTDERMKLAMHRPDTTFEILSNPEFLAAGTAINDLLHPDRILIGSAPSPSGRRAAAALAAVYAAWVPEDRILTTNVWSSELAKLVANSMLAQRISSINSISAVCERTGADVDEVAACVGRDPRIGSKFLKAGIGFGGSCFKKDVLNLVYLAESLDLDEVGEYWRQVVKMNEYQRDRFTRRVIKCLNNTCAGKKVTVLGYAFKKNTSDTRESPALEIINTLLEESPHEIAVFDPCCNPFVIREEIRTLSGRDKVLREDGGPLVVYHSAEEACHDSTAVLITTEFDEFRNTSSASKPAPQKKSSIDPRPFTHMIPSENELLALHTHLRDDTSGDVNADPLQRYLPEPECSTDCPDCKAARDSEVLGHATGLGTEAYQPKGRVDWVGVAAGMRKPKWVFDGRGVIDSTEMARLGVRVESVGRQGRSK